MGPVFPRSAGAVNNVSSKDVNGMYADATSRYVYVITIGAFSVLGAAGGAAEIA